jgi:hypothetical protein
MEDNAKGFPAGYIGNGTKKTGESTGESEMGFFLCL